MSYRVETAKYDRRYTLKEQTGFMRGVWSRVVAGDGSTVAYTPGEVVAERIAKMMDLDGKESGIKLSPREIGTVLAALRMRQIKGWNEAQEDIATNLGRLKPLGEKEIEALCERINRETR